MRRIQALLSLFGLLMLSCTGAATGDADSAHEDVSPTEIVLGCQTDAQCEDENTCTVDTCASDNSCRHTAVLGTTCDDGNACTIGDSCTTDGTCVGATNLDCDDANACTLDKCDTGVGCVNSHVDGEKECDGSLCSEGDVCKAGECLAGELVDCPDTNADDCTFFGCDGSTGGCSVVQNQPEGHPCKDGNPCTDDDTCDPTGNCLPGGPHECVSQHPCKKAWCDDQADEGTNPCMPEWKEPKVGCNDEDACTDQDECVLVENGPELKCTGIPVDCDDGNPCSLDSCDEESGCVYGDKSNGSPCDLPAQFCGQKGACQAGKCESGEESACVDAILCTVDTCEDGACLHIPDNALCNDNQYCNGDEVCGPEKGCQSGTPQDLDDGVVCTVDTCDEVNDSVVHVADNGFCDNQNVCDGEEACDAEVGCIAGEELVCDDGIECTDDSCDQGDGCSFIPDDMACDDGFDCTQDSCEMGLGCKHLPNDNVCDDGLGCTTDHCLEEGLCVATLLEGWCSINVACYQEGDLASGNECLVCKPGTDEDDWSDNSFAPCDDGDEFTTDDECEGNACIGLPDPDQDGIANEGYLLSCVGGETETCNDNCPDVHNPDQADTDANGVGDICDCISDCGGKDCGDDGCGGNCGQCGCGEMCENYACVYHACDGKQCGLDGCGGLCGECACGESCMGGACVFQGCDGRECGPDNCGGTCGTCACIESCLAGNCVSTACSDKECGPDGCGGSCGQCDDPQEACFNGTCLCMPDCVGKKCGTDGCGGSCGACAPKETCYEGQCKKPGDHLWSMGIGGTGMDTVKDVRATSDGQVFVLGTFDSPKIQIGLLSLQNTGDGKDCFLVKLGPSGQVDWAVSFGGSGDDNCWAVEVDNVGGIVVVGNYTSTDLEIGDTLLPLYGIRDSFMALFDGSGAPLSAVHFGGADVYTILKQVRFDGQEAYYVAGVIRSYSLEAFQISVGGEDLSCAASGCFIMVRLGGNGTIVWKKAFAGGLNLDSSRGLELSPEGNPVWLLDDAISTFQGNIDLGGGPMPGLGGYDVVLAELGQQGEHHWSHVFGGEANDEARALGTDGSGSIVLAGMTSSSSLSLGGEPLPGQFEWDAFLGLFGQDGGHISSQRIESDGLHLPVSLAVDGEGGVYVGASFAAASPFQVGGTVFQGGGAHIFKMDAAGQHVWQKLLSDSFVTYPIAIAVSPDGIVYIGGEFQEAGPDFGGGPVPFVAAIDAYVVAFGH